MPDTLIDSTIVIDAANHDPRALAFVNSLLLAGTACLHAQVVAEAMEGVRDLNKMRNLRKFLRGFLLIHPSESDSERALAFLQSYPLFQRIGFGDCCIGATALRLSLTVATLNVRDFKLISGLKVMRPY
jgi:predicted nucleic acid-binding protein